MSVKWSLVLVLVLVIMYLSAKINWDRLASRYRARPGYGGKSLGWISVGVKWLKYKNCIKLEFDRQGFYLKPMRVLRWFHPPLFIPWEEVVTVKHRELYVGSSTLLKLGQPPVGSIKLNGKVYRRMMEEVEKL